MEYHENDDTDPVVVTLSEEIIQLLNNLSKEQGCSVDELLAKLLHLKD